MYSQKYKNCYWWGLEKEWNKRLRLSSIKKNLIIFLFGSSINGPPLRDILVMKNWLIYANEIDDNSFAKCLKLWYILASPDLEINSTCWELKHNAKGGKWQQKIHDIGNWIRITIKI